MTDVLLRETERAVSQGDHAAEVRLLSARVRAGQLSSDNLALAAFCGHLPAQRVLGWDHPAPTAFVVPGKMVGSPANWWAIDLRDEWTDESLATWLTGLTSQTLRVQAGLAAAESVDPFREPDTSDPDIRETGRFFYHPTLYTQAVVTQALQAIRAWLDCPCDTHKAAAHGFLPVYTPDGSKWWTHVLCIVCLRELGHHSLLTGKQTDSHKEWLQNAVLEAARFSSPDKVRTAIQQALIAKALA